MQNLVPIKVKIGLRPNGHADHPDWYKLPLAKDVDPATQMSTSWKYDNLYGHQEEGPDSPIGMQWGMLFVTPLFAQQAKQVFPDLVFEMTEAEAQDFWENKYAVDLLENNANIGVLQALQIELDLKTKLDIDTTVLKAKIAKALDPNDKEIGLRKNSLKKWIDAKVLLGINIVSSK